MRISLRLFGLGLLVSFVIVSSAATAYGEATVATDKEDYQPGETVYITGTGWSPGETVSLTVLSFMLPAPPDTLYATADATGSIQNSEFVVGEEPLDTQYLIAAEGQSSGLQGTASFSAQGVETGDPVTVGTDNGNYFPGETVVITGSGWMPAESVSLSIYDAQSGATRLTLSAFADGSGAIYNDEFVVADEDLNRYFRLEAQGQMSGLSAETTFADATISFARAVYYDAGSAPVSVVTSDFDEDGNNDLAVANVGLGGGVSILRNMGNGTFAPPVSYAISDFTRSVIASDLDGDGYSDVAVVSELGGGVSILRNSGDGTFGPPVSYPSGGSPSSVAASDLDGDGDNDLAVANELSNRVSILWNNGDGTFAPPASYAVGILPSAVAASDLDGDGDIDLAVVNHHSSSVSILWNNGDGIFASTVSFGVAIAPLSVAVIDLDGDGDNDLAVTSYGGGTVSVLPNDGDGVFGPEAIYLVGSGPYSVAASDLDGDGDYDLEVANIHSSNVSILPNNGDGTFAKAVNYAVSGYPRSLDAGDLDGDGDDDLAVANSIDNVSILINVTDTTPPVPDIDPLPVVMGECGAKITDYPTATDDMSGTIVGTTNDPLKYTHQGTYTVHWTYTDKAGNTAYQDQEVIVQDVTPPSFPSCVPDVVVNAGPGECSAVVSYDYPPVSDHCITTLDATHPPGSTFPLGTTPVTLTATDVGGNTATCSFNVTVAPYPGTTCGGSDVPVTPVDPETGTSPVTITFPEVTGGGETSLETAGTGPPPPFGFKLGSPPVYYAISTTATFTGEVEICIDYSGVSFGNESQLRLWHQEGNAWVDRTSSLDTEANVICASVSSFSVFALFEAVAPASVSGAVTADCPENATPLLGVTVDLYEVGTGSLVATTATDENGAYTVDSLAAGYYNVTVITPLGYAAEADEVPVALEGVDQTVDFGMSCVETTAEPRGIGFWKHQVGVSTGGNGHADVDAATLCGYLDLVEAHFNSNRINPVEVYDPPVSDVCGDKLLVAKDLLNLKGNETMTARAKQQLMALLLNVSSGKLGLSGVVSADGATASQAITHCDNLIDDPEGDHETAKTIADWVNNAMMVPAGMVPLDTDEIAYAPPAPPLPDLPETYALRQNIPNPFNPTTQIGFDLPEPARVDLAIYDVSGRLVRQLLGDWMPAGRHGAGWDGRDARGRSVASGVYFYRIQAGSFTATRRMVLVR